MKLRWVGLLLLVVAPLVACMTLYGRRLCTAPWQEVPVALGWSASRPVWLLHPRWGEQYPSVRTSAAQRRASGRHDDPSVQKHIHAQGISLVLRDGLAPHDDHPLSLVLCSALRSDSLELFVQNPPDGFLDERVERVVPESLNDPLVLADWLASYWVRRGDRLNQVRAVGQSLTSSNDWNGSESDPHWKLLVEAGLVLLSNVPEDVRRPYVAFSTVAGVPDMRTLRPMELQDLKSLNRETYVHVMEQFIRAGPSDLEVPFKRQAAEAWQELGLDPKAATFAATNDQGTSSRIVGWHCSMHLQALENLAAEASFQGQFDVAADRIELAANVANQMAESVRSPWVYNYIQKELAKLSGLAAMAQQLPSCPPVVADRMADVIGHLRPATPRTLAAPSGYLLPAIYLDSLSRAFLSISVVTWSAAGFGWLCLRIWRKQASSGSDLGDGDGGSLFVAVLAVVLTAVAFTLLETCNFMGEGSASVGYAIAGIVLTVTMLMGAWWLVARELAHGGDPSGLPFRRRIFGLIGCAVIAIACHVLQSKASPGRISNDRFEQFERWAFDPTHEQLPALPRGVFALAFPALLVTYAVLRGKRWARNPQNRPLFHPLVPAVAGFVLGSWFLFGPFGEWVHRGRSPAPSHPTEWTPTAVAADAFGNVLNDYFYESRGKPPSPQYGRGWNMLTATLAFRVTNLGFWFVLACAALWAFETWRRDLANRLKRRRGGRRNDKQQPIGPVGSPGTELEFAL